VNAPFQIRASVLKEPFAAYVCDQATADVLKPVATELGWPTEKIFLGGLRSAVQSLSVSASPNILFVDMSESGDPLNDINALAEVCEPGTIVIAAGMVNDVRLYRDLVASGIQDYLLKPFSIDQVRDTFTHAQMVVSGPRHLEPTADRTHLMCAVIGARGGVGASTVAASCAWLFGDKHGRTTALLDLDIYFGTAALALDLEPGRGLTDAIENPGRIDGLFLERAMVKANERLSVLSAEAPITSPLANGASAFFQLQEEMKGAFECTVIDLPRHVLVEHPLLMHDAHMTVVVADLTLAATRDTIRILAWLKASAPQSQVIVVANCVPTTGVTEVSRSDFESSIERKIDVVLPFDQKLATQAAKLGKPLAEVAKATKLALQLQDIAARMVESADMPAAGGNPAARSLLGKFGDLKAMLPARKAKEARV
jgi:pilus assembly protein CpaE